MIIGIIVLGLAMAMLLFGLTQRTFDKMRLSTTAAVVLIVAMAVGIFIPSISIGTRFSFNIGGFLIPCALAIYFLVRLGTSNKMWMADIAIVAVAITITLMRMWIPLETAWLRVLAIISMAIIAAGVGYLVARSRRGAFAATVLGIFLGEVVYFLIGYFGYGWDIGLNLGSPAMFDMVVLGGLLTVVIAEVIGTVRERQVNALHKKNLQHEAGKEFHIDGSKEYEDYFRD